MISLSLSDSLQVCSSVVVSRWADGGRVSIALSSRCSWSTLIKSEGMTNQIDEPFQRLVKGALHVLQVKFTAEDRQTRRRAC